MAKNLKLKMARVEHDMTQGDLADAIGVTRQTIGLIEAGKYNPTLSLCLAICKTLDKTLDQLFWAVSYTHLDVYKRQIQIHMLAIH